MKKSDIRRIIKEEVESLLTEVDLISYLAARTNGREQIVNMIARAIDGEKVEGLTPKFIEYIQKKNQELSQPLSGQQVKAAIKNKLDNNKRNAKGSNYEGERMARYGGSKNYQTGRGLGT